VPLSGQAAGRERQFDPDCGLVCRPTDGSHRHHRLVVIIMKIYTVDAVVTVVMTFAKHQRALASRLVAEAFR
jgi:hypothetical protein